MTRIGNYMDVDLSGPIDGARFEVRDGIAFLTLARPERGNSLTPGLHAIVRRAWTEIESNPAIRVAVIGAEGDRHFCTGLDVSEADSDEADDLFADEPFENAVFWSPYQNRVTKPVLCAVNGLCVGGGLHFVVDSDIVLASRNAAFVDSHVNVGLVGAIENIGLAKRLPLGAALRMTLVGKDYKMPAERAWQLGLVDELFDTPEDLRRGAEEMARVIAANSPQALVRSKAAVWGSLEKSYAQALSEGWELLKEHWVHPDFVEGPRAFGERRAPRWNPDPNARIEPDDEA